MKWKGGNLSTLSVTQSIQSCYEKTSLTYLDLPSPTLGHPDQTRRSRQVNSPSHTQQSAAFCKTNWLKGSCPPFAMPSHSQGGLANPRGREIHQALSLDEHHQITRTALQAPCPRPPSMVKTNQPCSSSSIWARTGGPCGPLNCQSPCLLNRLPEQLVKLDRPGACLSGGNRNSGSSYTRNDIEPDFQTQKKDLPDLLGGGAASKD